MDMNVSKRVEKHRLIYEKLRGMLSREEVDAVESDADHLIDIGFDFVESGEFNKAYDLFIANMQLAGESADAINGLGIALAEMGETHKALRVMEHASALYSDDAITLANLASVYWDLCEFDKAIFFYSRAVNLNPEMIDYHMSLISLYCDKGDILLAYTACCELMQKFPDDEEAQKLQNEILIDLALSCS